MSVIVFHHTQGLTNPEEFEIGDIAEVQNQVRTFLKGAVNGTLRIRKNDGSNGAIACSLKENQVYNFVGYDNSIQAGEFYFSFDRYVSSCRCELIYITFFFI